MTVALLAGLFLAVAILGPIQQRCLNNPEGAMICQIVGIGFVAGAIGLGAFGFFWLSREANSAVEIGPGASPRQAA